MAPGCYSPSANKDIVMNDESRQPQQQQQQQQQGMETTLPDFANKSSILEICIDTPVDYTFHFVSSPTTMTSADELNLNSCSKQTETIKANCLENSYAGEINLDQIPLPSTPPPPMDEESDDEEEDDDDSSSDESSSDEESSDDEDEEEEEEEDEVKKEGNLLELKKKPALLTNSGRVDHHVNLIFDTADTFEILEQTIMKQKRLAKLKNTDLRRKVLLKRTFDLVLEIMDAENGFNDDEPDSPPVSANDSPMLSQATNAIEEGELVLNSTQQQQQQQPLELELHPDDGKPKTQLISTTPILSTSNHNSTTLNVVCVSSVKLVDYDLDEDQDEREASTTPTTPATTIQIDQARVPRQLKRRSSASDDDEEEDEEDEDCEEDYEYNTIYTNDQELNYQTTHLAACVSAHDLNIYNDNVQIEVEKTTRITTTSQTLISESTANNNSKSADSRRSDHPRKKLRAA